LEFADAVGEVFNALTSTSGDWTTNRGAERLDLLFAGIPVLRCGWMLVYVEDVVNDLVDGRFKEECCIDFPGWLSFVFSVGEDDCSVVRVCTHMEGGASVGGEG